MPSENELVEKIVTTHTSPSIADIRRQDIIDAWADWENDCERDRKSCDYDPID
ncbi:MAG: hypothetical protein WCP70_09710 [Methanothrix sp.]